jgi:hypothetical protein
MNPQKAWQSESAQAPRMSLAFVRHGASALESRTRRRNAFEYFVGVVCLVFFGFSTLQYLDDRPWMVAALGWFALWCIYYMYRWHRMASVVAAPADAGVLDCLRYLRQQLERQRDLRRRNWRWWGPAVLPGFGLFFASLILELKPVPWNQIAFAVIWFVVGCGLAILFLENEARRLQREIDALDSLASD